MGFNNRDYRKPFESEKDIIANPHFVVWKRLQLSKSKLKGVTQMAALMAGFSMVATVELDLRGNQNEYMLTIFAVTTALLVTSTMLSIMIATCILPHMEAIAKLNSDKMLCHSPHDLLANYIDLAWVLANTVSTALFIIDVVIISWLKFPRTPAICVTAIMIPALLLLCIFSFVFYRKQLNYQCELSDKKCTELELISHRLSICDGTTPRVHFASSNEELNIQTV